MPRILKALLTVAVLIFPRRDRAIYADRSIELSEGTEEQQKNLLLLLLTEDGAEFALD